MMTVLKFLIRVYMRIMYKVRIVGAENLPDGEGAIIAPNHISNLDPLLVVAFCKKPMKIMAKAELFKFKITDAFFRAVGAFPINRGDADITAVKTCLRFLKKDELVLLFPHGTRIKPGEDISIKEGVVLMALKARKNIVPCYISGTYGFRKQITLHIGKPYDLSPHYDDKITPTGAKEIAGEIWEAMKALDKED